MTDGKVPYLRLVREAEPTWEFEGDAYTIDGADAALLGIGVRCGQPNIAVYDFDRLVEVFVGHGMDEEDAIEYVEFNIVGAWVGPGTPLIVYGRTTE